MQEFLYRFRTINQLLSFEELEKQEIYFSSLNQLNDPMEGYRNIVWSGDKIVWRNFIKHYILCLEHMYANYFIVLEGHDLENIKNYVFKTEADLRTGQKEMIDSIYLTFFGNVAMNKLPEILASRITPIGKNELTNYFSIIHTYAINAIFRVYVDNKLLDESKFSDFIRRIDFANLDKSIIALLSKDGGENDPNLELMMDVILKAKREMELLRHYNDSNLSKYKNQLFLLFEFPEKYLNKLEKLMYPEWFISCFTKNHKNPSMWAHYADRHTGVCLKFKTNVYGGNLGIKLKAPDKKQLFFEELRYQKNYPEIDFFRSIGRLPIFLLNKYWYEDEHGNTSICANDIFKNEEEWHKRHWENFKDGACIKLADWDYEEEFRLILLNGLHDYTESAKRKLVYSFDDLEGIIFGMNTSRNDKIRIMKIIEGKCRKETRSDFKFYQSDYSKRTGQVEAFELTSIKFK